LDLSFSPFGFLDIGKPFGFVLDYWIKIDIYLISINQLLTQRCDRNCCYARALLLFFRSDEIARVVVYQP
jgi:hypothetical protein